MCTNIHYLCKCYSRGVVSGSLYYAAYTYEGGGGEGRKEGKQRKEGRETKEGRKEERNMKEGT
jgi:hypothetical protein